MPHDQPTPYDYGATGTRAGDDTEAFQAFVTDVATNGHAGRVPKGVFNVSGAVLVPNCPGWAIRGDHRETSKIVQTADNTPVLDLGGAPGPALHSYALENLTFDYATPQPPTNTRAVPVLVSQMPYQGVWRGLTFAGGHYDTAVRARVGAPWGHTFDDITFGSGLTGGCVDWSQAVNGVPNNHFGRLFVDAKNMCGTLFDVRGYNFTVDTIEVIAAYQGPTLFHLAPGGLVEAGTIKLENGIYQGGRLLDFSVNTHANIGHLTVSGHTMTVPSGEVNVVVAGPGSRVNIGHVEVSPTQSGGKVYVFGGPGQIEAGRVVKNALVDGLTNIGSSETAENITVKEHANTKLGGDIGDRDHTVRLGDPTTVAFHTPFTAPRVVQLPDRNADLFNGLTYTFLFDGAISENTPATIRCGGATKHVQDTDRSSVTFAYRRNAVRAGDGWTTTGYQDLP